MYFVHGDEVLAGKQATFFQFALFHWFLSPLFINQPE